MIPVSLCQSAIVIYFKDAIKLVVVAVVFLNIYFQTMFMYPRAV